MIIDGQSMPEVMNEVEFLTQTDSVDRWIDSNQTICIYREGVSVDRSFLLWGLRPSFFANAAPYSPLVRSILENKKAGQYHAVNFYRDEWAQQARNILDSTFQCGVSMILNAKNEVCYTLFSAVVFEQIMKELDVSPEMLEPMSQTKH